MRSTNNYPVFESKRDELSMRPFKYRSRKGMAMYRLDDWKHRHGDIKYKAMVDQKREPSLYASRAWAKYMALSSWEGNTDG